MRITELPQAIYRAINSWRVWVTLLFLASLILNEAALGIREGQTIVEALTRISYLRMLLLAFVCGVIAQAFIGTAPFTVGVVMTMIDFALRRRREWREEGRAAERRRVIAAIVADPVLTDAAKLQAIAAINSAEDAESGSQPPRRQGEWHAAITPEPRPVRGILPAAALRRPSPNCPPVPGSRRGRAWFARCLRGNRRRSPQWS